MTKSYDYLFTLSIGNIKKSKEFTSYDIVLVSMENFSEWINQELKKRGWSQADLARASGRDPGVISNLINNRRGYGADLVKDIAIGLKVPQEIAMRAAGILQPVPEITEQNEEISYLFDQLKKEGKEDLIIYARFLLEKQERSS